MGDRANVQIIDDMAGKGDESIFLYSHWYGTELPALVRTVLAQGERWSDSPYLARMIFSAMVRDDIAGSTGYGISATVGDGDDRIVVVDVATQHVSIGDRSWSFGEYAKLTDPQF